MYGKENGMMDTNSPRKVIRDKGHDREEIVEPDMSHRLQDMDPDNSGGRNYNSKYLGRPR